MGNSAGDGARIALLNVEKRREARDIAARVTRYELPTDPEFQDRFIRSMDFPEKPGTWEISSEQISRSIGIGEVLVADGATGTNLQKVGLGAGQHPEDWVFDCPDKIVDLAKAFIAAGSDIILTCTFGATRPRLRGREARR